ncbi:phosphate ABC transporter permease subunit PstC [Clostridium bovifaecis]|jgi:phosphate transport system permease protein|uniref:Phosphate transport system permease protein n=1 Tax=Clostridium bovifaecis TaxID=2184719 RepID=A0A6I6F4G9_9CLOT|nr:phosphate ABC transporter permease subunit PstC [Clostridium thermopalmarium]MBE6044160.1 phosphate ABC transporter permease subunit PstC [Clostridium thermopalmarium]QGU95268.1 phosphate ABC transporter permease subunit PstC [Clostridium bovifaecis]
MSKRGNLDKLKNEYLGRSFSIVCGYLIVVLTIAIIVFIASKGLAIFIKEGYPLSKFLFSTQWKPDAETPEFGALIFILGSTLVSIGAVIISAPIGIALAIFMNLISPKLGSKVLQPAMELFVGIPSVIYGWIGITMLIPLLKGSFGGVGFSLIAGTLVLSIMILPTITSISSDAIRTIPRQFIEASYGLGATRWQTIVKVVVPAAKNGILTGVVLGIARAFGEALAVQMVIGNSIKLPGGLYDTTSTLTSVITMDMANTIFGSTWNNALWSLALVLLVISFIIILILRAIGKRGEL